MTTKARDEVIRRVLEHEGGVADVGDGKGITRYGQTPSWLSTFNLPAPTNPTEAAENYAAWLAITRLDRVIGDQADDLALVVIDFAVHAGHVTAIRMLQASLGVTVDGVLGKQTEAALASMDRERAARHVLAGRLEQLGGLISQRPDKNARYALGWLRRIGEQIRQLA